MEEERGDASESLISHAGMRILERLVGVAPQSIPELTASLGVTRTAITEPLHELVEAQYVSRVPERSERRGRPQYRYTITPDAMMRFFPENQHLLVPAIWNSLLEIGGPELLKEVVDKTSEQLSSTCKNDLPWEERVATLVQRGGFDECEFQPDGSAILTKRTCKFYSMYEDSGTVCAIHLQTLCRILDVRVTRIASRHASAPCCRFRVEPAD